MRSGGLVLALILVGCAPAASPWPATAALVDEGGLWMASETALLVVPGNLTWHPTPEMTAHDAASTAWDPFSPNDCVLARAEGATVHYTLDDCTGSFNLVHASGHLDVTYLATTDGRTDHTAFHASSSDLVLNGGAVSFEADASVIYDEPNGVRTIDVTVDTHGVGPRGTAFTRHGTQTARWLNSWGCLLVDSGHDTISVGERSWDASTSMLTLCVGECPMAGGEVTWTGADGTLSIAYGGSNTATWSVEDRPQETGSLPLSCGI